MKNMPPETELEQLLVCDCILLPVAADRHLYTKLKKKTLGNITGSHLSEYGSALTGSMQIFVGREYIQVV